MTSAIAPAYLLACLLLGGSAQGFWQNALLQLVGLAIIAWAALSPTEPLARPARPLVILFAAAVVVVALQLVPLPPALWDHGARVHVGEGFLLLGRPLP